jgi:dihydrofolate reductase
MKVTLVMVASLDGRTTQGGRPGTNPWASPEDQEVFLAQKAVHDCIVMGSATYEAARAIIQPSADKPRIILTRTPERFAGERQPGLVFSAYTPQEVVRQIRRDGRKSVLLVGGAQTNARFLDNGLVDELVVVIEPLLFGAGAPLVRRLGQTIQLRLVDCERLNSQGTLLARYVITNNKQGV